jgi:hypothetical protein
MHANNYGGVMVLVDLVYVMYVRARYVRSRLRTPCQRRRSLREDDKTVTCRACIYLYLTYSLCA